MTKYYEAKLNHCNKMLEKAKEKNNNEMYDYWYIERAKTANNLFFEKIMR